MMILKNTQRAENKADGMWGPGPAPIGRAGGVVR